MKKRQVKKYLGALLLSGALFCTSLQTVYAEEVQTGTESVTGTDTAADGGESQSGIVPEPLAESGTDTVSGETTEVNAPRITQDVIEWNGGLLEIPVDLGDYTADELDVKLIEEYNGVESTHYLPLRDTAAIWYFFYYNDAKDSDWYCKAGDYTGTIIFESNRNEEWRYNLTIHVPYDSVKWQVEKVTQKFDGSQDVVFEFKNGTNLFEIKEVKKLIIFTGMGTEGDPRYIVPDMTEGFTCDMEAGTLTIDKDAFKTLLASGKSYDGGTLPDDIAINAWSVSMDGNEFYFNHIPTGEGSITTTAWHLDVSDLDLTAVEEGDTQGVTTVFDSGTGNGLSVSGTDADAISKSALSYIQNNYAEQLAALGDNYTVSSRIVLSEQTANDLASDVKEAFSSCAPDATVGKYYDISVQADVLQDGNVVEGLGSLTVPALDSEIQLNVNIPADLKKDGRSFMMLHYHNGQGTVLESSVTNDTITFKTSAFSPYAIAYKDAVSTTQSNSAAQNTSVKNTQSTAPKNTQSTVPKTGDEVSGMLPAAAAVISLCVLAAVVYMRKRNCR